MHIVDHVDVGTTADDLDLNGLRSEADPLDEDAAADPVFETTLRRQARLALVASETATRFARTGVDVEPMAWLSAPRRMFDGSTALASCGDRQACLRALVLHGLDLGFDGDPAWLDSLLDEDEAGEDVCAAAVPSIAPETSVGRHPGPGRARLFTAVVAHQSDGGFVHAFAAMVAPSAETLRRVLRERHGEEAAAAAVVEEGFPRGSPLTDALVTPALAHVLEQIADAPDSPLAAGLDVRVEQRFHA